MGAHFTSDKEILEMYEYYKDKNTEKFNQLSDDEKIDHFATIHWARGGYHARN